MAALGWMVDMSLYAAFGRKLMCVCDKDCLHGNHLSISVIDLDGTQYLDKSMQHQSQLSSL